MMKGIILAGGTGSRLFPITKGVNKQLLPIYDKPMIYYPLSTLMFVGIRDILIITNANDSEHYINLLGNGHQFGLNISYTTQEKPDGIAQAFIIGKDFIGEDSVCLILGDNIYHGQGLGKLLSNYKNLKDGAIIFGYKVRDPDRYGVVEFDGNGIVVSIEEKPKTPKSNYAITGLYFYDNKVVSYAESLKPSARGELEITDINMMYLQKNNLHVEILGRGIAWLDTGTNDSLLEASEYIRTLQRRQNCLISSPEEIAYRCGYINKEQFRRIALSMSQSEYGKSLLDVLDNEHI